MNSVMLRGSPCQAKLSRTSNIHEAKTHLSRIIDRVEHGEEIVISRAGAPVAKIVPLNSTVARVGRGSLIGQLVLMPDWDSPEVGESIGRDFGAA
jgi:prevent-host-death family protein